MSSHKVLPKTLPYSKSLVCLKRSRGKGLVTISPDTVGQFPASLLRLGVVIHTMWGAQKSSFFFIRSLSIGVRGSVPVTQRTQPPTRPPTQPPTPRPAPTVAPPLQANFPVNIVPSSTIRRPGGASFMVCNYRLPVGYTAQSIEWTKSNGSPLPSSRTQQYTCNTILYVYNLTRTDAAFYSCRVQASNALGQRISSQAASNVRVIGECYSRCMANAMYSVCVCVCLGGGEGEGQH